jgi:flagellar hook assembly protein FlgD
VRAHVKLPQEEDVPVRLTVYNVLGRQVATLVDGFERAGRWSVTWDGRDVAGIAVPSGAYVYRLDAGDFVQARTMLLLT